jgi:predicted alpha/beta-hydrolase family hydrolase
VVGVSVAVTETLQASHIGTSCPPGTKGHLANSQTAGAARGKLTAAFSTGPVTIGAHALGGNIQHFFVTTSGAANLLSAETNPPGKPVLSDSSESTTPRPPPP